MTLWNVETFMVAILDVLALSELELGFNKLKIGYIKLIRGWAIMKNTWCPLILILGIFMSRNPG